MPGEKDIRGNGMHDVKFTKINKSKKKKVSCLPGYYDTYV